MKQLKVLIPDTKCLECGWQVNRKRAEAADWTEVIYCDGSGMAIRKEYICNNCVDSGEWQHDKFEERWTHPNE
jgi:hypothetical protein